MKKIELNPIKKPQKRFHTIENNFSEHFPKNANEFRYIIEDINAKGNKRRRYENILLYLRGDDKIKSIAKSITIKTKKRKTKFKLRCPRYVYTLKVDDESQNQ